MIQRSNIHINASFPIVKIIHRVSCPDCKKNTFFISFYYEWDGYSSTCLRCGRNYNDGEWEPLPFYKYSRRDNINNAKKQYRNINYKTNIK